MAVLLLMIASVQGQEKLKVGEVKNGKLVLTNLDALKGYFMNSLEKSGALGKDYQFNAAPENDRFFLYFPVSGNKYNVKNIGILLIKIKDEVFIVGNPPETEFEGPGGGGSFEVQCFGSCPTCMPNIKWNSGNWLPIVYCDCIQGNSGECSMITKLVIHISI